MEYGIICINNSWKSVILILNLGNFMKINIGMVLAKATIIHSASIIFWQAYQTFPFVLNLTKIFVSDTAHSFEAPVCLSQQVEMKDVFIEKQFVKTIKKECLLLHFMEHPE